MNRTEVYQDKVYTVDEVAAIFRVPSDTVRRLIHRGELPAIRLGRVYRVPKSVIDGYFDLPSAAVPIEKLGFGTWGEDALGGDAVEYVNHSRDADARTLREVVEDLNSCSKITLIEEIRCQPLLEGCGLLLYCPPQ